MSLNPGERIAQQHAQALSDLPLIGREKELAKLVGFARSGTPALLCGAHGFGKTRLLRELKRVLRTEGIDAVHLKFQQPPHTFLVEAAKQLGVTSSSPSSTALRGALWSFFESKRCVLLLDDIADATPPSYRFFERVLATKRNTIIGSAAEFHWTGSLKHIFWNAQTTTNLRPLVKRNAATLVDTAIQVFLAGLPPSVDFADRVIQAARGNPGRIVDMCIRAGDPSYRAQDEHLRFAALVMDSVTGFFP